MDIVVRGRGERVPEATRARLARKLARLSRFNGRLDRVEVEITREPSPRVGGGLRIDAACRAPRKTYRASATGQDVDGAADRVVKRLERQISRDQERKRARMLGGAHKVKSARMPAEPTEGEGTRSS